MRIYILGIVLLLSSLASAQRDCASAEYLDLQKAATPGLKDKISSIETFIAGQQISLQTNSVDAPNAVPIIRIPVVVHVLYSRQEQNLSIERINSQIAVLNDDFRRTNADTVRTPQRFRPFAADVQIEFYLATSDPSGRPTNGIVRKATSIANFRADDKIKFSSLGGSDAWDSRYYLNIWVGNLQSIIGYSSVPGAPADRDGIVVSTAVFGVLNNHSAYNMGRTAVHEAGHWLGLKHIWGDQYCGDDHVDDTPAQGNFTPGCPTAFRTSCSNGTTGDMYMNYMDYTSDACVNLFTLGQKQRMRALFAQGGPRNTLVESKGLSVPWNYTPAAIEVGPEVTAKVFPNPALNEITVNLEPCWIGKIVRIHALDGSIVSRTIIKEAKQKIVVEALNPGIYFIAGENNNERLRVKFIKL
jgi:hypothetical protein